MVKHKKRNKEFDPTTPAVATGDVLPVGVPPLLGSPTPSPTPPPAVFVQYGTGNSDPYSVVVSIGSGLNVSGAVLTATGGSGTVTSIAVGTGLSAAPSPITGSGTISIAAGGVGTTQLAANAVTYAKIQAEGANSLIGNPTGSPAVPSEITPGAEFSFSSSTLHVTGCRPCTWNLAISTDGSVTISTGTDVAPRIILTGGGVFLSWYINAKTAPVGASLVIDVLKSSNGGSTWTSLWATNPGNRPTLATTVANANGSSFDTTTFSAGDLLRLDVITAGSTTPGSNIVLTFGTRMTQA